MGGWRNAPFSSASGDIQKGSVGTHCGSSMPALKSANGTYKPKDLIGIPWMLAFSLRNAGWYLRQDIIWHKPNPMPESVTDRCTKSHEYIFLLSKSQRYYFDHEAIQEPANPDYITRYNYGMPGSKAGEIGGEIWKGCGNHRQRIVIMTDKSPTQCTYAGKQDYPMRFILSATNAMCGV